jgi:hypothetical protein
MPSAKTYGELRKATKNLLQRTLAVQKALIYKQERLLELSGATASRGDDEPISDSRHFDSAVGIEKTTNALEPIVNPEELWSC